ncbi:hypothetical protein [Mucisphaera sp.]|uniref:hypothetical protein n=1 Tax=Mucisphaera sp. TaxID=2913024 RepID=UPI003D0F799C
MAEIEIGSETEEGTRWHYPVTVYEGGRAYRYEVTLGFADYDLWSRGRAAPSKVVRAAFEFLLEREGADEIMGKFDCSVIRRYFPEVDEALPKRV